MTRATARVLGVATASCLVIALGLVVWPVSPSRDLAPAGPAARLPVSVPSMPEMSWDRDPYWQIVESNVLSPTREDPEPGGGRWVLASSSPPAPAPVPPPEAGQARPVYRLSGVVRGPEGPLALIDADPAAPGAELYRVGDAVGPYRLIEATDSTVVLTGSGGRLVLRLASS